MFQEETHNKLLNIRAICHWIYEHGFMTESWMTPINCL